jgi:hypothetical protein
MIALEPLIAKLATEEEIGPFIREPVVPGLGKWVLATVSISSLGAEMLDVTVRDVINLRFTKCTLAILRLAQ